MPPTPALTSPLEAIEGGWHGEGNSINGMCEVPLLYLILDLIRHQHQRTTQPILILTFLPYQPTS
jgi:hypothetical protein